MDKSQNFLKAIRTKILLLRKACFTDKTYLLREILNYKNVDKDNILKKSDHVNSIQG